MYVAYIREIDLVFMPFFFFIHFYHTHCIIWENIKNMTDSEVTFYGCFEVWGGKIFFFRKF